MTSEPDHRQERLEQAIAAYLEAVDAGHPPDQETFLREHPDLAEELKEFFRGQAEIEQLADPAPLDAAESPAYLETTRLLRESSDEPETKGRPRRSKVGYFGDYELLAEIARGGMGVVYRARQVNLDRTVALKMILAGQLASEADVKRFYQEAEAAANLEHPGIVPIFEVGQHEGQHFFSMAYVDGPSLALLVSLGPLPPSEAANIVRHVAQAIAYAHERGVIHRDLKPANVLLARTEGGSRGQAVEIAATPEHPERKGFYQPKVTDFGLAKKTEGGSELTGTGQILGTPSYMPPEQATGQVANIGPQADVYSLGAILYCLLTGRPPFQAANVMDTLLQVLEQEPLSPRQLNPAIPKDLETICLKCLNKDRRNRYASAQALAEDLGRFLEGRPVLARPIGPFQKAYRWAKRNRPIAYLMGIIAILLLTGFVGGTLFAIYASLLADSEHDAKILANQRAIEADQSNQIAQKEKQRADREASEANLAKSDAQSRLARLYLERGLPKLEGDPLAALPWFVEALKLSEAAGHAAPIDRLRIGTIFELAPKLIAFQSQVHQAVFSPDGGRLAMVDGSNVLLTDPASQRVLFTWPHEQEVHRVLFHPGGELLLSITQTVAERPASHLTARLWNTKTGELATGPVEISNPKFPPPGAYGGDFLQFSPDGAWLLVTTSDHRGRWNIQTGIAVFDARTLKPIAHEFYHLHSDDFRDVVLSPDCRRAFTKCESKNPNAKDDSIDDLVGHGRVWEVLTGKKVTETFPEEDVREGVFSPDGQRILVYSESGTARVYETETGKPVSPLLGEKVPLADSFAFHPDGSRFVAADATGQIMILETATGKPLESFPVEPIQWDLQYSPDGQFIIYRDEANAHIWRSDEEHSEDEWKSFPVTNESVRLAVTADSSRVVAKDYQRIQLWDAKTARPVISNLPHDFGFGYELSHDGRWLITTGAEGFRQWELPKRSAITRPFPSEQSATARPLAFDEKAERVLMLRGDKSLEVRSTETGESLGEAVSLPGEWSWGELASEGKLVVLVGRGPNAQTKPTPEEERLGICQIEGGNYVWETPRDVQVVNLNTGRPLTPVLSHPAVSYAFLTPDGETLIVIGNVMEHEKNAQGEIAEYRSFAWLHFWDIATGRPRREPLKRPEAMTFLGFDPAGEHAIVAYDIPIGPNETRVEIRRYRLSDWQKVATVAEMTPGQEDTLTISPDRKFIAWAMPEGQVAVCDLATGKLSSHALGHADWSVDRHREVARLLFSPDSRRLASATSWPEAEIRVWDIATGDLVGQPLEVGDLRTETLAFSADGNLLASVFLDEFRVWDVNQGLPAIPRLPLPQRPKSPPGPVAYRQYLEAACFTPNGQRLLLAGRHGLSALELTQDNRPTQTLERWAAILAGYRINRQGAAAPLNREDFVETWDRLK